MLTIYHLYPELLNLYGDKGNIAVLKTRCEKRGIKAVVKQLKAGQKPDFNGADIVLLGGGSDREQLIVSRYRDMVAQPLKEYVENGGVLLAVCAGFQLMGNFYEAGGECIPCFGVLDIDTVSGEGRLIGNAAVSAVLGGKEMVLAGFENHGGRTDIKKHTPLGRVIFGFGSDGRGEYEGVVYKNTVATYLHGPILPKNPELADFLIETALKRKYADEFCEKLAPLDDTMEMRAKKFIIEREKSRIG